MELPKLVVCIIASAGRDDYKLYTNEWTRVIDACRERGYPIQFYFLRAEPTFKEIKIQGDIFVFPCAENLAPGIFKKTIGFYKWVFEQNIEFDYMVRTNLSSFYHFKYLLDNLTKQNRENYVCGMYVNHRYQYPTGCGAVFSKDVIKKFVDAYQDPIHHPHVHGLFDDQAFGYLMHHLKVSFHDYKLPIINIGAKDNIDEMLKDTNKYHYRLKTSDNIWKRIENDVPMYKLLVDKVYYST